MEMKVSPKVDSPEAIITFRNLPSKKPRKGLGNTHLEQWLLISRSFKDGISDLKEMRSDHKKRFFVSAMRMLGRHSSSK